ncbi:MarR family winged helix-turn-helix transcriptional regulator [Antrihabitans stalactiti]|uniref:MarR family transcriptional regulator n=1 Tax=Antrihabitans stalactiti TaxID=2584121 RepID=A0A848KL55_9NOCA|nr:MarR family transcriptional regulator [Antrihabitans stalactiti]NMN97402.1 MarR family transcriptional regulator [Antrihabitans stalactiti]
MRSVDTKFSLSLLLRQVERKVAALLVPALEQADLSLDQWRVMAAMIDSGGVPMAELAEASIVAGSTLTRHVDRLVDRGLVIRRIDPTDRRKVIALLSPRGESTAHDLRRLEMSLQESIVERLGNDHFHVLTTELERLDAELD